MRAQVEERWAFLRDLPPFGRFHLRPLRLAEDLPVIHGWVSQPYARFWGLVGRTPEEVARAYEDISRKAEVYLGHLDGAPRFLLECYRPSEDIVGAHYPVLPGDRGMHLLLSPPERPLPGFSWAVFRTVMDFLFSDPRVDRIVVEPDIRNTGIHALNRRAGFRYQRVLELPGKTAHLAFCTREDHARALGLEPLHPAPPLDAHLAPEPWAAANRALVRKALSELLHERVLEAKRAGAHWVVAADDRATCYRFEARVLALNHWDIDEGSVVREVRGDRTPLDALQLILDVKEALAIPPDRLPVYLEEIFSTLWSGAYKHAHQRFSAADLVHADFQEIEGAMVEGHPCFIANSGRVGFDARDHRAYAPEAARSIPLVWLAAHRRKAEVSVSAELTYEQLLEEELGAEELRALRLALLQQGLDPQAYHLFPAHPWQWFNRLALTFAPEIASRDLVCLGYGTDRYQPQQSLRTLFNVSRPERRYVKTALSVLNMGFLRGLSADFMRGTPAINDWLQQTLGTDAYLQGKGFRLLREVAAVGYRAPHLEAASPPRSPYRKMLAALWRDSPLPKLKPGQRVMTMAALLHLDRDGQALLPQLIKASGLDPEAWVTRYLDCYLAPLLHCFMQHDLAFMPHGENVLLVLEGHAPMGTFLKDLAEEVALLDPTREVPEAVARIRVSVPEALKVLSLFTDIFDGFLRFLPPLLSEHAGLAEDRFWRCVAACIHRYRDEHPALAAKLERFDLFAAELPHSCLNRLQLRNNLQMVDLADPAGSLQFAGTLVNPITPYR